MTRQELEPFVDKRVFMKTVRTEPHELDGQIRTLDWPRGYAGGNEDGEHSVRFTATFEHFLRFDEILSVRLA